VLYAATRGGLFRSSDSGVSWQRKEAGLTGSVAYAYCLGHGCGRPGHAVGARQLRPFQSQHRRRRQLGADGLHAGRPDGINDVADAPGGTGKLSSLRRPRACA
jgi:hypothetical protein